MWRDESSDGDGGEVSDNEDIQIGVEAAQREAENLRSTIEREYPNPNKGRVFGTSNVTPNEAEIIARCFEFGEESGAGGYECAAFVTGRSRDTITRCKNRSRDFSGPRPGRPRIDRDKIMKITDDLMKKQHKSYTQLKKGKAGCFRATLPVIADKAKVSASTVHRAHKEVNGFRAHPPTRKRDMSAADFAQRSNFFNFSNR